MKIKFSALSLIPLLSLAACQSTGSGVGPAQNALPETQAANFNYVAMGSSYAAGAGIGPAKSGTPARCGRTQNNYATLLAERTQLRLNDQSCGGATTTHLLEAWDELPAQISAVTPQTELVTITIGGNDLNYMGLLFSASCDPEVGSIRNGVRSDCAARVHLPTEEAYAQTERNLIEAVQVIHETAPNSLVVFVQYVALVPDQPCADIPIDSRAQSEARALSQRLATLTERAATLSGAIVVPVEELSGEHTACGPTPWSRGFDPAYNGSQGAPWHPTAHGHAQIAEILEQLIFGTNPSS